MKTILVTGFGLFGGHEQNPTQFIANSLNGLTVADAHVVGITLPVVYGEDTRLVFDAIERYRPHTILSLGLSAGSDCAHVEMFAVNHRNGDGDSLQPILPGAPAAYFATIDVDRIAAAITGAGIPAVRHGYAGSYLCNHIFYQTLHRVATRSLPIQVGFIHLPHASEHVPSDIPSLPLALMQEGIRVAIEEAVASDSCVSVAGGIGNNRLGPVS